ncbi:MAG: hypothetical protein ACXW5U_09375 [Thermoanaerobaculia bacterium]
MTVLTREGSETFSVSDDEKRELLESIAQAKRGEFVEADDLLRELDESNRPMRLRVRPTPLAARQLRNESSDRETDRVR